jgi:general secretion pathway protein I
VTIRTPQGCHRSGLSLLEVLVALSIFLFAMIGIGQLITLSANQALEVEAKSQAVELCRSKLNEVACGAVPLSSQSGVAFDEDPDWTWSLDAAAGAATGLWNVTVTVARERPDGSKTQCVISQIIIDPAQIGSATDAEVIASMTPSTSTNSSGNSTSSGTGSTSPTGSGNTNPSAGGSGSSSGSSGKTTSPSTTPAPFGTTKGG